jgi:hypothetical protein
MKKLLSWRWKGFQPPEIIDTHTIRFTAREVHWQNLGAAGGFLILPKHVYEKTVLAFLNRLGYLCHCACILSFC